MFPCIGRRQGHNNTAEQKISVKEHGIPIHTICTIEFQEHLQLSSFITQSELQANNSNYQSKEAQESEDRS